MRLFASGRTHLCKDSGNSRHLSRLRPDDDVLFSPMFALLLRSMVGEKRIISVTSSSRRHRASRLLYLDVHHFPVLIPKRTHVERFCYKPLKST